MNYYLYDGQFYRSDELCHWGIKGMKWGVRRYQNEDGTLTAAGKKRVAKREARGEYAMTKREVKKSMKNGSTANQDKVYAEYEKEFRDHKRWNELGRESTKVAKELMESEERDYESNPYGELSKRTKDLYKRHAELDKQMTKIEIDIGKKYIEKFNDARLKDINYGGSVEKGQEMLEAYNKAYRMRKDGYIPGAYVEDEYIRPHNM